ncbi:MAG: hypothetical protein QOG71_2643 [Pyrinomonadaceae bacterium]|nr:hypothetical protein [Pyrinomonadaceae bacterium]
MRKVVLLTGMIVLIGLAENAAYACSCVEVNTAKKGTAAKTNYKRWLKGVRGAVFTGRVTKIETDPSYQQSKVTFEVERYWKGVQGSEVVIMTAAYTSACGVPYTLGETYFVVADGSVGKLSTDLCSHLGYSKYKAAFIKGMGKGHAAQH